MESYKPSRERTIKVSEFKDNCLQLIEEVANFGGELIITKNNHPVARLVPYQSKPLTLFGIGRDKIAIHGDIIKPLKTKWEVDVNEEICWGDPA